MRTRLTIVGCLVFASAICSAGDPAENEKKKVLDGLQGEWKAEKALIGGMDIVETLQKKTFLFKDKKITIREDDKDTDNQSKFEIDTNAKPAIIDVETKEGDKLEGIFELKKD